MKDMPNLRSHRFVAAALLAAALSGACGGSEPATPSTSRPAASGAAPAATVALASLPKIDAAAILDTTTKLALESSRAGRPARSAKTSRSAISR